MSEVIANLYHFNVLVSVFGDAHMSIATRCAESIINS